jgi:hypothetical protein
MMHEDDALGISAPKARGVPGREQSNAAQQRQIIPRHCPFGCNAHPWSLVDAQQ